MDGGLVQDSSEEKSFEGTEAAAKPNRVIQKLRDRWKFAAIASLLLLAGATVLVPRWLTSQESQPELTDATTLVRTVTLIEVQSYTVTRSYTGEVKATRTSEIGFERSGTLVWIGVDEGDRVQAGEAIARLDTRNQVAQLAQLRAQKTGAEAVLQELRNGPRQEAIAAARSQVSELQNQLALEEIRRDRREYLHREGAISREQLDEVAYGRNALQDRLTAAQSQLAELENGTRSEQVAAQLAVVQQLEASIADLEITIAKSTLTAPFTSVIGERRLDEGAVVSLGQAIARLVENATSEAEVGVPVEAVSQLSVGSTHPIQIGQQRYSARVIAIKPEVSSETRTRTVILAIDDANLEAIAPDQIVRLEVTQTVPAQGFWLPVTALTRSDRGLWSCFVLADKLERRDVEVLHTETDRVLVRGLLQAGDRVVTEGVQRLVPGQSAQSIP
ncbi:efflux RND transporter periplasmic adaptor subunit [Oculatella sp. FACHB-28]|uniref:efflux RND transporter periplasmic adaptor subunit n=1 Tax=Oculatella sp. FACHB-28 TaxID=2692845 RepID=UPI0016835371|nr:efflux RND transporter periplasmic adaptor subunit [Oculatella sp. FACHB-28]MBD2057404.1 efflux RND transporter periplasmic adaptor subunit [Oculatella sp. FACHB-28]